MATGEVRVLRKRFPDAKFIIGNKTRSYWNEVFDNNPHIVRGSQAKNYKKIILVENYEFNTPYRVSGPKYPKENYNWNPKHRPKRGEIFFTQEENNFGKKIIKQIRDKVGSKKIILVEPYVKIRRGYENRDWGFEKWQKVINNLNNEFAFLHVTFGNKKPLQNTINLHGVNFRSTVSILSNCDFFIGCEGGMHHAAAATLTNALIIFGGFISPKITGYDFHTNIYIDIEGSPCGSKLKCKHCEKCMEMITPDYVCEKIGLPQTKLLHENKSKNEKDLDYERKLL